MAESINNRIGKYEIVKKLGEGATSTVYLAQDAFNNREVAIKLVSQTALNDENRGKLMHNLFLNEASLAGKLNHPHIVQIYDAVADEDDAYIVMEYVPGGTLQRFTRADNLLALGDVIEVVYKCARALDFASQTGVIHRDIKPANILVMDNTDIKITDFGSAALQMTTRTMVDGIGTPAYMSPEQHMNQPINLQTDIYALGVVMFQLLTGRLPFTADNIAGLSQQILNADPPLPSELRQDVPTELDMVVRRAMARDQAVRYMSWEQFASDLAAVASGAPLPRHGVLDTEKFNILRTLSFFKSFGDVELWEVLRFSEWVDYAKDEVIINEGDPGDFFGILVSGEARVLRKRRLLLSLLKAGECVGEMAYLGEADSLRSADVVAATDVRMIKISVKTLERASELCRLLFDRTYLRILVERLAAANSKLAGI